MAGGRNTLLATFLITLLHVNTGNQQCTWTDSPDTDVPQGNGNQTTIASSLDGCKTKCDEDSACVAISFGPGSGFFLPCELFYYIPSPVPVTGATFSVKTCQDNDPCANTPCKNAGTCHPDPDASTGFNCSCSQLYTGDVCDAFTDSPPTCSSHTFSVSFPETTSSGVLVYPDVNCSTLEGQNLLLNFSSTSDGPFQAVLADGNPDTDHLLVFLVNATEDLLYKVGIYQVMLFVHNELGQTTVTWNITVEDVNQTPAFLRSSYTYTVAEDTLVNTSLAQLQVETTETMPVDQQGSSSQPAPIIAWDPDNFTDSFQFRQFSIADIEITFPNSTTTTVQSQSGLPVQLADDPYVFFAASSLSPGFQYKFTLKAEDGLASADTQVTFTVSDINDPPSCQVASATLDLVTSVGEPVYTLACSDPDVNATLATLTYTERAGLDSEYFSVNESGVVTLDKRVPIDATVMTFGVDVTDGGGLSDDVNITFAVNRDYPPQCTAQNMTVSLPEDANTTQCATASLSCSHDSALDVYNISMTASSSTDAALFGVTQTASSPPHVEFTFTVCPASSLLQRTGQYDWDVAVASTLGSSFYQAQIAVDDVNQAPEFEEEQYELDLSEETMTGTTVARVVTAIGPGSAGVLEILLGDVDTQSQFTLNTVTVTDITIINPDSTSTTVTSQSSLPIQMSTASPWEFVTFSNLNPGVQYIFNLKAEDNSGLADTALLTFRILDINSPPTCQPVTPVALALVTMPPAPVVTLSCSDQDVNETLSALSFSEYAAVSSNYFRINQTGTILLISPLPIDSDTFTFTALVTDGGGLNATVVVVVNIMSEPPTCTPPAANVTFQETDTVGTCSDVTVTCAGNGPHGSYLVADFAVLSDGTGGEVNIQQVLAQASGPPSDLRLKSCVAASSNDLLTVGRFTTEVNVSTVLGSTILTWDIAVVDVNQAPEFGQAAYTTTVLETASVGSTVALVRNQNDPELAFSGLVLVVSDPDTITENFKIKQLSYTIRAEYTVDGAPFEDTFVTTVKPIQLAPDGNITVQAALRPDLIYVLQITAEDGEGLTAAATLTVHVEDVNEPPSCDAVPPVNLTLVTPVSTHLLTVSCSDSDFNTTFRTLTYTAYAESDYDFFNVSESGDIVLAKDVPRDKSQLVLRAVVTDGGGEEDDVFITFSIFRDYPPSCNPTITPPAIWRKDECFRLVPNCQDPSTAEGDNSYMTYNLTGGFLDWFSVNISLGNSDFAEYCYDRTSGDTYSIQLKADNGLGLYTWTQTLDVVYLSEVPRFDFNQYKMPVAENVTTGHAVVTVRATVGNDASVMLLYSLEGDNAFSQYFALNPATGVISVQNSLADVVNSALSAQVSARDPDTNLTSSVLVTIEISDVNEPPVCDQASVSTNVPWNVATDQPVARVTCTDPDPTAAFRTLTYDILDAGNDGGTWGVSVRTGEVFLVSRDRLSPDIVQYDLTVRANDSVYADDAAVTVTVNRTVPVPTVQVSSVTSNTVVVSWTVDSDYLPVINGYSIGLRNSSDSEVRKDVVGHEITSYNLTGLEAKQSYSVDVTVNGKGGDVTSESIPFTTPEEDVFSKASVEFKLLDESWSAELMDTQSSEFLTLGGRVKTATNSILSQLPGYVSNYPRSFRMGSVYVDMVVTINQRTTYGQLENTLAGLQQKGDIGGLSVDAGTPLKFYRSETYITAANIEITATRILTDLQLVVESADVTATCSARSPGISNPSFRWTLSGVEVTSSGRFQVSALQRASDDPYGFSLRLDIASVALSDTGELACSIEGPGGVPYSSVRRGLTVVSMVTVGLVPRSVVIAPGSDVNLTCTRAAGYPDDWQAKWYHLGANGEWSEVSTDNKTAVDKSATHTVSDVRVNAVFQCEVIDSQDVVRSGNSDIIILEPEEQKCPEDGQWPSTPAGTTITALCPAGYQSGGETFRTCRTDGQWQPVDSSGCVKEELADLANVVNDLQQNPNDNRTGETVQKLFNATSGELLQGDVKTAVNIMDALSNISGQSVDNDILRAFVQSADNLLQAPTELWENRTLDALTLVNSVDKMGAIASRGMDNDGSSVQMEPIATNKIVLQVGRTREDIQFPNRSRPDDYPAWVNQARNSAFLSKEAFPDGVAVVPYSAVLYRNLTNVFPGQLDPSLLREGQTELSVNSPILTLSVDFGGSIQRPVELSFEHISGNFSSTFCTFWNPKGYWSSEGCSRDSSNLTTTVCVCDHLTNFAVLMSPYRPSETHASVLSIITIVGCSISILCLVITIIVYAVLWKYVKSTRSVLLVNLCVVLLLAYVTFLAGVDRTDVEIACKVVSALLHYLFLVVFFLMLCEGLDIFISVVVVFPIKSIAVWLLLMAYGAPAVVVGISLGMRLDGYGGPDFCWLSLEDGLMWAFVGPALATIVANFIFVARVIRALMSSTHLLTKSQREMAKSILKAICVMTPILGLTWVFGVFSVNEDTVVFQYLFLVFNTLQGLFIFLFHCLLSKQIRDGLQNRKRRYLARSSAGEITSKMTIQKQTSEAEISSNDLGKKTSSPFLQVDRQVHEMAAKVSRMDNLNLLTGNEPSKDVARKDPVPIATPTQALNIPSEADKGNAPVHAGNVELTIEAGNLKVIGKPARSPGREESTMPAMRVGSLEDSAQQVAEGRRYSKRSEGSGSKGSGNSRDRKISQEQQRKRLDHVYGAGARISDSDNLDREPMNVSRVPLTSQSTDDVSFTIHKNPVYNDIVLPTSQADRWLSSSQSSYVNIPSRQPYPPDPRYPQAYQQAGPSSPRRLAASAESLGQSAVYHPLAGRRVPDNRSIASKRPPPRVAPKPGRGGWREPPVDYW